MRENLLGCWLYKATEIQTDLLQMFPVFRGIFLRSRFVCYIRKYAFDLVIRDRRRKSSREKGNGCRKSKNHLKPLRTTGLGDVWGDSRKCSLTFGRNPFVESLTTDSVVITRPFHEHVSMPHTWIECFLFLIIRGLFLSFSLCSLFKNTCIKSEALRSVLSACVPGLYRNSSSVPVKLNFWSKSRNYAVQPQRE